MRLRGKIAVITAAASGMGRAGAKLFAAEGAKIVLVDIDTTQLQEVAAEITADGGEAHPIALDLSEDAGARQAVATACHQYGGLDLMWNHVGYPGPGAFEKLSMDDYQRSMDMNLRTVLISTTEAIPAMRARGGGSVLFTSSIVGLVGSRSSPVYAAGKFAVNGLMQSLAVRYAKEGIRFNSICPGGVDTPMLDAFTRRPDQEEMRSHEEALASLCASTPMGRIARPIEIAWAALFLLSDEASYITGVALPVDGGYVAC